MKCIPFMLIFFFFQVPNLSWKDVIVELDHAEFIVKDRQGLNLLFTGLRLGLQNQVFHPEMFPVDIIYRHWKNGEGQVCKTVITIQRESGEPQFHSRSCCLLTLIVLHF